MGEISYEGPEPPWRQLYAILKADIESGKIPPGRAIPSKRVLHETYGLAIPTISKAIDALKAESYIRPAAGLGLFVTNPADR